MSAHDDADGAAAGANGFPGGGLTAAYGATAVDRRRWLLALLANAEPHSSGARNGGDQTGPTAASDGPVGLQDRLALVCAVALSEVGVDGAGVTVMGSLEGALAGARDQIAATGALTRRLEGLQLTTGEGPCLDAYRWGRPVLVADLDGQPTRWQGFSPEAARVGAAALFSLPLHVGAVRLGTLDLHRRTPGSLSNQQLSDALTLATLATEILLELAARDDRTDTAESDDTPGKLPGGWLPDVHADVHVAAGMLSVRAGVTVTTALLRLRGYAFAHGEPIHQVARHIINRDLVLDPTDSPGTPAPPGQHDPPEEDEPPASGPENEEP